ncbi:MAG: type II secretion system F family protein [Gammaproteobacteria bacterium]|nr:type II secretion system F family protein [Gammaproteobacteria bacterium]
MAAFEYLALDASGKRCTGVVSADSTRGARQELRRRQLVPLELAQSDRPAAEATATGTRRQRVIRRNSLVVMTRQLATLLQAGAPVAESLQTLSMQTDDTAVRNVLLGVRGDVLAGAALATGLGRFERSFDAFYRAVVAAGEKSGNLGEVLGKLADYLEADSQVREKLRSALIYPAFLLITSLAVIAVLMIFVVPKVVTQFDSLGRTLPALTRGLIMISDTARVGGLPALIGLAACILGFGYGLRYPAFRARRDELLMRLPVVGRILRDSTAAGLAQTVATLLGSGAPLLDGLAAARHTVANGVLRNALAQVASGVRGGLSLSAALRGSGAFPPLVGYMAAMGERSGDMESMLRKSAEYLRADTQRLINNALVLLEPIIIVVMGGVVGAIVLAIMLPILQLNTLNF